MPRQWRWIGPAMLFLIAATGGSAARGDVATEPPTGPVSVSEPVVPTITKAVRDLPDPRPERDSFVLEVKRREEFGFVPTLYPVQPRVDPLVELQRLEAAARVPDGFGTPTHNYEGQSTPYTPPDATGDVGPTYFVQTVNQATTLVTIIDKSTGEFVKTFTLQSLASTLPCSSGYCDAIVQYDRAADRWILSQLPTSGGDVCVYVSTTGDPNGSYYAYDFVTEGDLTDYPKYGVWPQNGAGGSYLLGANAWATVGTRDLFAFDREKMLAGQPATFQKFSISAMPNSGIQLVLPSALQGNTAPPDGEPAIFARPRDDEAEDGASTPGYDLLELWALSVDWSTPANSTLTNLPPLHLTDFDMTLCGMGSTWNCMPQPDTTQKIDPIREPLFYPFAYRNFGDHQALVGTFAEDVDGTDHAALRWFELRRSTGSWFLYQEGVVGGEANVHRSVASIGIDQSGNIAMAYTRTGTTAPYYPSIYYKGRLATDPLGTMPQGEYVIADASNSMTVAERWGDYAGGGIDPVDDCTFWFTTEYGGWLETRVAAVRFDACGCLAVPEAPTASLTVPSDNRIDVGWNDSPSASITQYGVLRATTPGGPYTTIATVTDSSPGVGNGSAYTYHDDTVSGGIRYYYVVKSNDGLACTSAGSAEVDGLATGGCRLAPAFGGITGVLNPGAATCTLNLAWTGGSSSCGSSLMYNVYRSTTAGFVPSPANRIATGVTGTTYADEAGITGDTTYYYVVRAADPATGVEDANTLQSSAVPTGPITNASWTDTFEATSGGGFDLPGWTRNIINGGSNWTWSTVRRHDGTHSWLAQDVGSTSDMVLASPAFRVGPATTLSFWHTYRFEGTTSTCYDGGTLEYTLDGTMWMVVPSSDFTSGGYTGTINPFYTNPLGGRRGWCAGTIGTMTQVTVNLGGDANFVERTVRLRWHAGSDYTGSSTGWFVDTVTVSNLETPASCATACTAAASPTVVYATLADGLKVSSTGAAGYDVVRGSVSTLLQGGFSVSTDVCLANDAARTTFVDPDLPVAGDADWYLVRAFNACGVGTYDDGSASQIGSRDAAIAASEGACP